MCVCVCIYIYIYTFMCVCVCTNIENPKYHLVARLKLIPLGLVVGPELRDCGFEGRDALVDSHL